MQALSFLVLVVVRWKFLEIGGQHGQPGHIHLPTYRFVMPVAQSIAWVSDTLGCSSYIFGLLGWIVSLHKKSWLNAMFLTYFFPLLCRPSTLVFFQSYAFVLCMLAAFTRHIVRPSRIRRMLIVYAGITLIVALLRARTSFRFFSSLDDIPDHTTPEMHQRAKAEFGLSLLNATFAWVFAYVIMTTNKGPQVYFEGHKLSAETNASFFRWITYNWMNDIMWSGYERALELEYLPSLTDQMRARPMYRLFARTRYIVNLFCLKSQAGLCLCH